MMKLLVICLAVLCAAAQADQSTAGLPPPSAKDAHAAGGARNEKSLKLLPVGEAGHHGHEKHSYHIFHVDFERVEIPFIIALWIFVSSLAKIGFHMTPKLHHIFPESCLLIVVGIIIGFLLFLTSEHPPSTLTPNVFFFYMLPPIILDAGYFMPNRLFFDHLGTILLMAVAGTIFNVFTIGIALWSVGQTGLFGEHDTPGILETLLFSSLVSAVDPVAVLAVFEEIQVNEILYIVVFGESLLNDAVTVVLYHTFEAYVKIEEANIYYTDVLKSLVSFIIVAGGGTFIGVVWGYVTGFVTRFTNHATVLEPLFVFTMAYLSYLTAEIFEMSGILAITFCGITMKNYVERNVSSKSQTTIKYAMKMLSSCSETTIFMFLGVSTIHDDHDWNWWFVVLTIVFCTVFRCIGVFILSGVANKYRLQKLGAVDQFVMMYGGLRGAVAFALVLLIDENLVPHAPMFVTTTIAVVYWTVFVQGITIKPLVKFLNVKTAAEKEPTMNERITGRFMDHIISGVEGILGEFGNLKIRDMYRQIDTKYIKPCLLRENKVKDPKIIETYETITNDEILEYMKRNPSNILIKNELETRKSVSDLFQKNDMENVDLAEVTFNQSNRDIAEAKVHHLLTETMNNKTSLEGKLDKKNNKRKKKEENRKVRVTGSQKKLLDDHVHAVMANEMASPPTYQQVEDEYINFFATDSNRTDGMQPELPWRTQVEHEGVHSKDYVYFNRRESQSSLHSRAADTEAKKKSRQINDIEFLNALTNRKGSTSTASGSGSNRAAIFHKDSIYPHEPTSDYFYREDN